LIQLADAAAYTAMTIRVNTTPRLRAKALAAHTYSIPVVRELPRPTPDPAADRTW
jgi:hypothetical protein